MIDESNALLLPREAVAQIIAETKLRLSQIKRSESRYRDLAEVASIHQEIGNRLSKLIYDGSLGECEAKLACVAGCATCCIVPSLVRQDNANSFVLTLLDIITLLESYPEIKADNESLLGKATARLQEAQTLNRAVPCPYLHTSGNCGIYNQRPVSCKIWFSFDLQLCIKNLEGNYSRGVNPLTDASSDLRQAFEEPFEEYVGEIASDMNFGGYDYLDVFHKIAVLDDLSLLETFKQKIDAGEFDEWEPA